jgi:Protein of unknown function (DUF2274)
LIELSQQRFEALAGYTRLPQIVLLIQEAAWFSTEDERLLGLITWDTPERLIPPMIERFIATDRSYAKTRRATQPG